VSVADVLSRLAATFPAFERSYREGGWERGVPYNLFVNARQVPRGEETARLLANGDKVYFFLPAAGGGERPAPLPHTFFLRPTLAVARDLLGRRLVRVMDGQRLSGRIVEVEAYIGEDDQASHASRGRTQRNQAMYGHGGLAYVYLIYGVHYCLNVVTERENFPAAVLIRGIEPEEGIGFMQQRRLGRPQARLADGPGKLCQALAIDRQLDGWDLTLGQELWLEPGAPVLGERVSATPRVGVAGDEVARAARWRFVAWDTQPKRRVATDS
jgi:DNA-3-methyladenine glycosylase